MPADVRSIDAIARVRDELARFALRGSDGVDELEAEIRRVLDWVEHDRPAYWKLRVRKAYDAVGEAKAELHRCLMYPINDENRSCTEQRQALKKAEAHLRHCRDKQERVREWAQKLRHELHEYHGRVSKLKRLIEVDTPRAVALADRSLDAIERYLTASGPRAGPATAPPAESEVSQDKEDPS
ncbi:MAG: hypothetical protein AAF805_13520 [Planctomycetota bacterium]